MVSTYEKITKQVRSIGSKTQAQGLQRFFKTGPGEYGEGDIFLGISVPQLRILAKKAIDLPLADINKLIKSKFHEERLLGLIILTYQYAKADDLEQENIFTLYLKNTHHINNWDLVDLSAPNIVGCHLSNRSKQLFISLAHSSSLWERRIAIVGTHPLIRNHNYSITLKVAKILLRDQEDLIHKAVGWMLREVGKRDESVLVNFLMKNYTNLPRTTLRYAIERFPEKKRKEFLQGTLSLFGKTRK